MMKQFLSFWPASVSTDEIVGRRDLQPKIVWFPFIATWWYIVCFKQSHRDSRHCSKNTTARLQNTVARRSNFEMLLTNGL